jgi:peptidoglycan/LPS O-acetylase OafA/YrhL
MRPLNPANDYFPLFDWLRIILAVMVALSHDKVISWQHAGNLSVQVFFALSGWLIGGILLNTDKTALPRFFFNRVTRIWIPYALAISLLLSASLLRDTVTPKWLEFTFYKITFVYNLFGSAQLDLYREQMPLAGTGNHFWSICAEEQFYLLSPLLLVLLPAKLGKSLLLWLAISAVAINHNIYGAIALGVAAAISKYCLGDWHLKKTSVTVLVIILGVIILGLIYEALPYALMAPGFSVVIVLLLARIGQKNKIGRFAGGISYPFYLNHWIGVFVAHELLEPFGLREAAIGKFLALITNFAIASALYLLVDVQIQKFRASWFNNRRGLNCAFAAYGLMGIGLAGGLWIF